MYGYSAVDFMTGFLDYISYATRFRWLDIHYRQQIWKIFVFIFVGSAGVSVFEIHSFESILLLGELFRTQQQNKAHGFNNNNFGTFSVLDTG